MEFILLGDLHIERQKGIFKNDPDIYYHQEKMLDQVIDYAKKNGGLPIVQTGDSFDHFDPAQESLKFLVRKVGQSKLDWHFNLGNHELSGETNALTMMDEVAETFNVNYKTYLKPTHTTIEGQGFIFLPWPYKRHSLLREHEKCIVISHIEYNGMKLDNGRLYKDKDNAKSSNFKTFGHFFGIGHLHAYQRGSGYVYCGSPLQNNFGESAKKYFLHVSVGKNFKVTYKRIRITPTYILKNFHIKELQDLDNTLKIIENRKNLWAKLFFYGNTFGFSGHPKVLEQNNKGKAAKIEDDKIFVTAQAFNFDRHQLLKHNLKEQKVPLAVRKRTLLLAKRLEKQALGQRSTNIT